MAELLHVPGEFLNFLHISDALPGIADTKQGMIQLARDARLYPSEGCIDFKGIIERMPPVDYSIELPNLSRIKVRRRVVQGSLKRAVHGSHFRAH